MQFSTIDLGRDYSGKITDFAKARNSFLDNLKPYEYVLFLDSDEEATPALKRAIDNLSPEYPYYWVRRIELYQDRYLAAWNPNFKPALVSNRVRFIGSLHERIIPKNPHGQIDIPIIHNHTGDSYPTNWLRSSPLWNLVQGGKKTIEVLRGR